MHLFYAVELFFTPKYVKAKEMADQGAFGQVYLVKQSEMHFGPHADWFWDIERSGGGVFMDMGCHGLAFAYWFLGRPEPVAIADGGPSDLAERRIVDTGHQMDQRRLARSRLADECDSRVRPDLEVGGSQGHGCRGALAVGASDADRVHDRATFEEPRQAPEGIEHVIVGGVPVVEHGRHTGARPGRVLTAT